MAGLPVTIRLLDPPLHEFLPHGDDKEVGLTVCVACRAGAWVWAVGGSCMQECAMHCASPSACGIHHLVHLGFSGLTPSPLPPISSPQVIEALAKDAKLTTEQVYETIDKLQEVNPMLGFRGCRLGITYPEITEMQVRVRPSSRLLLFVSLSCQHTRSAAMPASTPAGQPAPLK